METEQIDEHIKNIGKTEETKNEMVRTLDEEIAKIEKKMKGAEAENAIYYALQAYQGEDAVIDSLSIPNLLEKMPPRINTGNYDLDKLTGGFGEENLVVISGPTGQGKTLFAQNLTAWLYKENHKTLWFSFEMSLSEIYERFQHLEAKPVFYIPKSNVTRSMVWLERKIVEGMAKFDTKFVVIDHTHYLFNMRETGESTSLYLGDIIRQLKLIARKYGIVIFLIHHLKKTDILEGPTISDLRDSSFVGQEADYVLMVWRKPIKTSRRQILTEGIQYTNETLVSVVKNRPYGKIGTIKLIFKEGVFIPMYESYPKSTIAFLREDVYSFPKVLNQYWKTRKSRR